MHNAGAELMLHTMLRDLVRRGWTAVVLLTDYRGEPYERDGVHVAGIRDDADLGAAFEWCDVAVTHLDATRKAMAWSRWGRPLVHVVHNHRQLFHHNVRAAAAQLVVWNSEWVKRAHGSWRSPSIVVRPPVSSVDYRVRLDRHGAATLLNLYAAKGAPLFWQLAEDMPDRRFVAVRGAYGGQIVPSKIPRNVQLLDNTPDVCSVYARTGVLLVPSSYESWGRVAVEAMASGIPVIANPTPGLVEALTSPQYGPCARFVDCDDVDGWVAALRDLERRDDYQRWSALSLVRSSELDRASVVDLDRFAAAMCELAETPAVTSRRVRSDVMTATRPHDPFSPHAAASREPRPRRSPSPLTAIPENLIERMRRGGLDDAGERWLQDRFEQADPADRAASLHDIQTATQQHLEDFAAVIAQYVGREPFVQYLTAAGMDEADAQTSTASLAEMATAMAEQTGVDAEQVMRAATAAVMGEPSALAEYAIVLPTFDESGDELTLKRYDAVFDAVTQLAAPASVQTGGDGENEDQVPTESRAVVAWIGDDGKRAMSALLVEIRRSGRIRKSVRDAIEQVLGPDMVARSIEQAGSG